MAVPKEYIKFIESIKYVRQVSGYGLKDAKDFVELVRDTGPQLLKLKEDAEIRDFIQNIAIEKLRNDTQLMLNDIRQGSNATSHFVMISQAIDQLAIMAKKQ